MTRDVRIQESGVSQDFSDVKTVTTPVVGGGNATWMPEDETAVGEITITGNGEFVPSEHNLYGFYKVNVMVPGGGQGEYVSPGGIGVNVDGTIPMAQPNGTISNVRIGDGPYTPPPAGMGGTIDGVSVSGGTIAGIDPDTGDYVQYTVTDSNGVPTLVKTTETRPASIRIITPPNKTTYEPGGLILFSGLTVGVYDQNDNPFTAPAFTQDGRTYGPYDGTIPFHELNFPVKHAAAESETMVIVPGMEQSSFVYPVPFSMGSFSISGATSALMSTEYNENIMYVYSVSVGYSKVLAFSKEPNQVAKSKYTFTYDWTEPKWTEISNELSTSYTYNGKTVYMTSVGNMVWGSIQPVATPSPCTGPYYPYENDGKDAWALVHGQTNEGGLLVPVEWASPYDGITYGDHFKISVKAQEDNSGTGGGGGHSF